MKKFSKIYTLMATALLISAVPVHGMQEIGAMVQTGKEKAIQQFNESVERMQKCFRKRKCTRTEALKVARDLSIAALAAIGIVYGVSKIGRPIQVGDTVSLKKGYGRLRTVISRTPFTATIRSADETEQTVNISNITLEEKGVSIPESPPIPKGFFTPQFKYGDKVIYQGQEHTVITAALENPEKIAIKGDIEIIFVPKADVEKVQEE